jgi:hypothetical protein
MSSQTTKAKMSTISIPQSFQTALSQVTNSAVSNAIAQLSERYGFDAEEAGRDLKIPAMDFVAGATKGKAKSATTKKNGEPKKKRGTTGYLVFSKEMREEVKAEMEAELGDGEKLQPKLVVSELAKRWKELDDGEKTTWNDKAKAINDDASADDSASDSGSSAGDKKVETKKVVPTKKIEPPKAKGKAKADVASSSNAPPPDKPKKKKANGYLLYANENRAAIKEEMMADRDGEKVPPAEVVKALAAKWKALSDEEKAEWTEKARSEASSGGESD